MPKVSSKPYLYVGVLAHSFFFLKEFLLKRYQEIDGERTEEDSQHAPLEHSSNQTHTEGKLTK